MCFDTVNLSAMVEWICLRQLKKKKKSKKLKEGQFLFHPVAHASGVEFLPVAPRRTEEKKPACQSLNWHMSTHTKQLVMEYKILFNFCVKLEAFVSEDLFIYLLIYTLLGDVWKFKYQIYEWIIFLINWSYGNVNVLPEAVNLSLNRNNSCLI